MKSINELKYWSVSLTAIITLLIFLCFTLTQVLVVNGFSYLFPNISYEDLAYGNLGLISIIASTVGIFLISRFIKLKDVTFSSYLNIFIPKINITLVFVFLSFIVMFIMELVSSKYPYFFESDFAIDSYQNANSLPLFYLGVVLFAPFFEEFLFRGFLFKGLEKSSLGGHGAVFISSTLFAIVHIQYGIPILLLMLLPFSILLGYARWMSGSLLLPILIHVLNNLTTCILTHFEIY